MIRDARKIASGSTLECDVCVVGAGAAGIALTLELKQAGVDVILLEAGGVNGSGKSLSLYRGECVDRERHLPLDSARYRQLGGTTRLWGGRCIPFDGIDFEQRSYIPHSGWPFGRSELDPYYAAASSYCECGEYSYRVAEALADPSADMIPGFIDSDLVTDTIERWSPPTNFGKRYRQILEEAETVQVLLNAACTEIELDEKGESVTRLAVNTFARSQFHIRPRRTVLAGGGLEVVRLLLASNKILKTGIGNHSDWLGRGYMCHFGGVAARVRFSADRNVIFGYELDRQETYCRRRLWISEQAQRREELLNIYMLLDRPLLGDPEHGSGLLSLAFLAKKLFNSSLQQKTPGGKYGLYWRHFKNILTGSPEILMVLPKWSRARFLQGRRIPSLLMGSKENSYYIYYHAEQSPNRDSRVTLSEERDCFGVPRLKVDYRVSDKDIDSVYRAHQLLDRELRRQECGELTFVADDPRSLIRDHKATLGHHIGTTRMAGDAGQGVVDQDCKVHGIANLYIASSSIFPTSSQANPTLTIVAMAIRLAKHLDTTKGGVK